MKILHLVSGHGEVLQQSLHLTVCGYVLGSSEMLPVQIFAFLFFWISNQVRISVMCDGVKHFSVALFRVISLHI